MIKRNSTIKKLVFSYQSGESVSTFTVPLLLCSINILGLFLICCCYCKYLRGQETPLFFNKTSKKIHRLTKKQREYYQRCPGSDIVDANSLQDCQKTLTCFFVLAILKEGKSHIYSLTQLFVNAAFWVFPHF